MVCKSFGVVFVSYCYNPVYSMHVFPSSGGFLLENCQMIVLEKQGSQRMMSCKTRKILKSPRNTVDGSEILHQLMVYPIIDIVLYIRGGAEFLPSTVVCPCNTLVTGKRNVAVAIENGPFEDLLNMGIGIIIRRVDCPNPRALNMGIFPASYVSFAEGSPFWCFVYFSLLNVNLARKTAWFSKIGPLKRWLTI